uniref:F-box domain-containing protein n=1 Tax=Leersia perrieri TaxID=77586 RepID=A0A0D9XML9_9ORYZ
MAKSSASDLPSSASKRKRTTLTCSRDWSSLGGVIADRVLANDIADFIRFRAVCRPWRLSSSSIYPLHALDPRHWIMLKVATGRRRRFLNVATGERIHTEIHRSFPTAATTRCSPSHPRGFSSCSTNALSSSDCSIPSPAASPISRR